MLFREIRLLFCVNDFSEKKNITIDWKNRNYAKSFSGVVYMNIFTKKVCDRNISYKFDFEVSCSLMEKMAEEKLSFVMEQN